MNQIAPITAPSETLPALIDKATAALDSARTSAEVLEARDMARVAYDAAKSAARMHKAKQAHGELMVNAHMAQAEALAIRARAEYLLAEEYDAAQPDEAKRGGRPKTVVDENAFPTAADLGLRRDEIYEARKLRDAERDSPGATRAALDRIIDRGDEPTRAALKREIIPQAPKPTRMDPRALWLWGSCLKEIERQGLIGADPKQILNEMTEPMRADCVRLLPLVRELIEDLEVNA